MSWGNMYFISIIPSKSHFSSWGAQNEEKMEGNPPFPGESVVGNHGPGPWFLSLPVKAIPHSGETILEKTTPGGRRLPSGFYF